MTRPEHNKILTVPKPGKVEFVNRPYPRVKPGSVLVKTEIAAVCVDDRMYTDHIHEWFDHPLYGVGHEGVGTVVEAPESRVFKPGDKVLISHGGLLRPLLCVPERSVTGALHGPRRRRGAGGLEHHRTRILRGWPRTC